MVPPYFQAYSCQKNGRGKRKNQITTPKLLQQQTKKIDKYKCDSSQTTRRIEKSLSNYAFFQQKDYIAYSNLQN